MKQLLRCALSAVCLVSASFYAELGSQTSVRAYAQSEFDGCILEFDRCYRELTTRHINLRLSRNVEWLHNQALEDFRNQKSIDASRCNQYAERMCHMWEQAENNKNYTGKDMRNFAYDQQLKKETPKTTPQSTNNRSRSTAYQEDSYDHSEYARELFEEDSWEYEDCIRAGKSEGYCEEEFWEYEDCIWEGESDAYCEEFL